MSYNFFRYIFTFVFSDIGMFLFTNEYTCIFVYYYDYYITLYDYTDLKYTGTSITIIYKYCTQPSPFALIWHWHSMTREETCMARFFTCLVKTLAKRGEGSSVIVC